jgi:membrane fusion protein, multidrug efflux system
MQVSSRLLSRSGVGRRGVIAGILAFAILGIVIHLVSANKPEKARGREAVVPVLAGMVGQKDIPVQLLAIGKVEAYATVSIKIRVTGELTQVHFREGQEVKKGDLLFTIDPRPYQAALDEAQARLERDTALLAKAEKDAERYSQLVKGDYVSADRYEQARSSADALRATVAADKAQVDSARLQLGYCYIRSPLTGRTGSLLIKQGSMIKANEDTGMMDIAQIQPIYVSFSVPEQNLPNVKEYMTQRPLKVEATPPGVPESLEEGTLTFIDNQVNRQTGTILLKGTFANKEKHLWPGQFVNVVLTLTTRPRATVVPAQAIQVGQEGQFVYVIKPDLTVEPRPVVISATLDGEAVVEKGLTPGERVVTDGQLRLMPGAKVEIKDGLLNGQEKRT